MKIAFNILLILFFSILNANAELVKKNLIVKNIDNSIHEFYVEIADNDMSRSQGLMWREVIEDDNGMLFIWNEEAYRSFWMKNTPISLDIIFFDKNGKFINVVTYTKPYSLEAINSAGPSKFVLELAAGQALKKNISFGSIIVN